MEQIKLYLFHRNDRVHRIKPDSMIAVSNFQNRRWCLVTVLEQLSGFWPRQSKLKQYPLTLFHFFLSLTIFLAMTNKLREYMGIDTDMTIECCIFMLFNFAIFIKRLFAIIYQSRRQKLYKRIAEDFETMRDPEEVAVLNKGAEGGFKYTLIYMYGISLCVVIFDGTPVLRAFYNYFFNHHELKVQLPVPLNFGFDHSKYWYIIAIDFTMWAYSVTITDFAYDLSFILQVHHVASLFKIVRIRLRNASDLVDEFGSEATNENAADESYSLVTSAIDLHVKCLDLVKEIEKSYTVNWFIILLLSTGGVGVGLYVLSIKLHDPIEAFRFSAGLMILFSHFQVIFAQGQIVIDSSSTISDACYECKWYGLPKKSCKLLTTMMIRTSIPCQLTGAKMFTLSMETFRMLLKAGLSYYTVFRSKRK